MNDSFLKDQNLDHSTLTDNVCESYSQYDLPKPNSNSFFKMSGLFVGLNPKGLLDCDSVRSPTSPLDVRVFSRSPRSSYKSWDCGKVGLSIVDSLDGHTKKLSANDNRSSDCKNIIIKSSIFRNDIDVFGKPKSLPKNYPIRVHPRSIKSSNLRNENSNSLFEIGEGPLDTEPIGAKLRSCSLGSGRCFSTFNSFGYYKPGSNSNFFRLETRTLLVNSPQFYGTRPSVDYGFSGSPLANEIDRTFPSNHFLNFCYYCKKRLDGEDIYMYRGEKAFCSLNCREQEIFIDGETNEAIDDVAENFHDNEDDEDILPEPGVFFTT